MTFQIVLLGTGTPNAEPWASGPSTAVIINDHTFIFDAGPGVVRACTAAFMKGTDGLRPQRLSEVFITHLHSDHTAGLADLILTPWVLERERPLRIYGPKGIRKMTEHLKQAYAEDIAFRTDGPEKANATGIVTEVTETAEGPVYEEDGILITAVRVSHGTLESYAYIIEAEGKKAVISGDTCPVEAMKEAAKGADLFLHEAEYTAGLRERTPQWQIYHSQVHTLSADLAELMNAAHPKLTVTYHRILHLNYYGEHPVPVEEIRRREDALLQEIRERSPYPAVNGHDGEIFTL